MTLRHRIRLSSRVRRAFLLLTASLLLIVALPALAQTETTPEPTAAPSAQADSAPGASDPAALARRLMGVTAPPFIPPLTPQYAIGAQLDFNVGKTTSPVPTKIRATLVASVGNIDLWVENGVTVNATPDDLNKVADTLDRVLNVLRWRVTYTDKRNLPTSIFDPTNLYPLPDIDNDPHIFLLYTTNLADDRQGVYNPYDSQPASVSPGGSSNQHELIALNTTPYAGTALSDDLLTGIAIRALFDLVMLANNPKQPAWLTEALGWYLLLGFEQTPLTPADAALYLNVPDTALTQTSTLTTAAQTRSGQQLFLNYFGQRYGSALLLKVFTAQGSGLEPFSSVLAQHQVIDPVTGANVTGVDAFADFVTTNGVNAPFGDGRFFHLEPRLDPNQVAAGTNINNLSSFQLTAQKINQYGAAYLRGGVTAPTVVTVKFDGQATTPRLPMPSTDAPDNHFYWSGGGRGRDAMLTQALDLSAVRQATLTFDAWFDLASAWNYGYVEVSKDDGQTWQIVPSSGSVKSNRNGLAYGPGFTGISNPNGPQPFPIMGVVVASDGITVGQIVSDGPAAKTDLKPNDQIIGYDGQPWPGPPDVLGLLGEHNPGDTLKLLVKRGTQELSIPITLGAHPTRVKEPKPLWKPETVDLTPFAGSKVVVRFEYLSIANRDDQGFAVDNLAVPELGFRDDAETDGGWTLDGWQRVGNSVPQRFLVQAITTGSTAHPPAVRSWIGPESDATSGQWKLALDAQEGVTLAISALSDETLQPATYSLQITSG